MSEEPKITTVEKVKNPGRVAQGKRLAAISKEAKARKAEERRRAEKEEECTGNANLLYVSVGVLGVIGLGYGTYSFLCKKEEEPQQEEPQTQEKQPEKKIILMTCRINK